MNEHAGLPVSGYKPQTNDKVQHVNLNKELEERVLRQLDALADSKDIDVDQRWLAIGRTAIENGFMAVNRSVFRPDRAKLEGEPRGEVATPWPPK